METTKIIWGLEYDLKVRTLALPTPKVEKGQRGEEDQRGQADHTTNGAL